MIRKGTMAAWGLAAALGVTPAPASATPPSDAEGPPPATVADPRRAALVAALEAPDTVTPASAWADADPALAPLLATLARDTTLMLGARLRAVDALGAFAPALAIAHLLPLVDDPEGVPRLRGRALLALVRADGPLAGERAVRLLAHPSPDLRSAAARTAAHVQLPGTGARLRARLRVESHAGVRAILRRALSP